MSSGKCQYTHRTTRDGGVKYSHLVEKQTSILCNLSFILEFAQRDLRQV